MAGEPKTRPTGKSVTEFLRKAAPGERGADCAALVKMMRKATGKPPVMWGPGIVGFGSFRHTYGNGREADWPLTGFSPRKGTLVVYAMCGTGRVRALLQKLGPHKHGVSCLYIKRLADVDTAVLARIIAATIKDPEQIFRR